MKKLFIIFLMGLFFILNLPMNVMASEKEDVTKKLQWLKNETNWVDAAKPDSFDCSNMTAKLVEILKDYDTRIVYGFIVMTYVDKNGMPQIITGEHVQLKIKISDQWWWIEPTVLEMSPEQFEFFIIRREFKTVNEAIEAFNTYEYLTCKYSNINKDLNGCTLGYREFGVDSDYYNKHVPRNKEGSQNVPADQ